MRREWEEHRSQCDCQKGKNQNIGFRVGSIADIRSNQWAPAASAGTPPNCDGRCVPAAVVWVHRDVPPWAPNHGAPTGTEPVAGVHECQALCCPRDWHMPGQARAVTGAFRAPWARRNRSCLFLFGRNCFASRDARDQCAKGLIGKIGLRLDEIAGRLCRGLLRQGRLSDLRGMGVNFHSDLLHFQASGIVRRVELYVPCTTVTAKPMPPPRCRNFAPSARYPGVT